jgi:hypothetical protein
MSKEIEYLERVNETLTRENTELKERLAFAENAAKNFFTHLNEEEE